MPHLSPLSSPRSRSWVRRILRRLRRTGVRPAGGSVIPHRPVNLLPEHGASTSTKEHGTRIQAMAISEVFSSYPQLGLLLAESYGLIEQVPGSSYFVHGSSTVATATRGANGAPLGRADCDERSTT